MSSTFPFVPRTVTNAKRKPTQHGSSATTSALPSAPASSSQPLTSNETRLGKPQASNKVKYSNEDYTSLIWLALSDYALWADPDLRRKVEWSSEPASSEQEEGDGFFPLSYLLKHSKLLAPLKLEGLQTPIVKALRSGAADVLEVRLLVADPSSSTWFGGHDGSRDIGAYEIRRKDWAETLTRVSREFSRTDWDQRTIYVESIPVQCRTIPAISRFILALLADHPSSKASLIRVQGIILPPHHQDKPGDQPTCKGFALVVLEGTRDVDFLLQRWPWDRQLSTAHTGIQPDKQEEQTDVREAIKFGFRTLSKLRWDQLKEEYLSYRGRLVKEINAHADAEHPMAIAPTSQVALDTVTKPPPENEDHKLDEVDPTLDHSSPYPFNSLVFVRNIQSETNKTTLRKFFATAFGPSLTSGELQGDGLDYVDFFKGMDSCHLRLATPKHAQILIDHFLHQPTLQARGLDEVGVPADGKSPAVVMELVTGRREELYWEKVPEKVRRQAVEKAIALMQTSLSSSVDIGGTSNNTQGYDDTRKRKRRKH